MAAHADGGGGRVSARSEHAHVDQMEGIDCLQVARRHLRGVGVVVSVEKPDTPKALAAHDLALVFVDVLL